MTVQNAEQILQENIALRNELSLLNEDYSNLQQQLEWLKKQVFGRKTEQAEVILENGTQLSLFANNAEKKAPEKTVEVKSHPRKKKRTHDEWMSTLFVEEKEHKEEHPICEKCGSEMVEIGVDKVYDELVYTPAKYHIRRHIVYSYKCPNCGENPENDDPNSKDIEKCNIRRAYYPKPMIPGSYCSPELLAHIIYQKYGMAVPLHRQARDLASKGIPLLKATMSNWVGVAAETWIMPIVQAVKKQLLSGSVIHADETRIQVLHEEGRKPTTDSWLWAYCNGKMNDVSIVIFEYSPTRKGDNPKCFLDGFNGYLVCDGYDAYNSVEGAKRCGCMTHTRRGFVNAMPADKNLRAASAAAKGVEFCNRIYHEESQLKELSAEERYDQRLAKVKPLLDEFFAWLEALQVSGKSKLSDAVNYALNEKKYLYTFLEDGNIPIDNNRAENAIRPFTIGRKNWLFSNTANGAKCSADLYSVISTAQANGLDAEEFLTKLFSNPAGTIMLPWRTENERSL